MISFSIKELEIYSGIKAHTIRTWEQRFSFLKPQRSDKLRRRYTLEELKLLLDISFLNRSGYKVSTIAGMDKVAMSRAFSSLTDQKDKEEKAVNELIMCMAMMDIEGFEMVLESCTMTWNVHEMLKGVVFPFLQKAGFLQAANSNKYSPAHFLVEQSLETKIIIGIEKAIAYKSEKSILFFLIRNSSELELLYVQYQLKMAGFVVNYISSTSAVSHLTAIARVIKPAYIVTSLSGKAHQFDLKNFLHSVEVQLPESFFLNLGLSSGYEDQRQFQNIININSAQDLVQLVSQKQWQ